MKKFFYLFLTFIMIFSNTGCTNKSSEVTAVTTGLSFTAEIEYGGINITADTVINSDGVAEFKITFPEEIADLCYIFDQSSVKLTYRGLEYPLNADLPETNALGLLYGFFQTADTMKDRVVLKDDSFILECTSNGSSCRLLLGQSGLPIELVSKDTGLSVTIKNAAII